MTHRRFHLERDVDHSGMSGTGVVAEGVEFTDGTSVVRWLQTATARAHDGVKPTTVVFPDAAAVEALHGHGGATRLVWDDQPSHQVSEPTLHSADV